MARLPIPGSDDGTWGDILNDYLGVELNADGSLKNGYKKPATGIPQTDLASSVQTTLSKVATSEQTTNKGVASGYASLDSSGKIPTANLPSVNNDSTAVHKGDFVLNVKDYSVTGDGVTDDSSAINSLLSSAADGSVIAFPQGTYLVGSQITWSSKKLTLVFEQGSEIKELGSFTIPIIFLNLCHGSVIRGLTITGSETTFVPSDSTYYGMKINQSDDVTIERMTVTAKSRALFLNGSKRAYINTVHVTGMLGSATSNPVGSNFHNSVVLSGVSHSTITNIIAHDVGSAVLCGTVGGVTWGNVVNNVRGHNCFDNGIYLDGTGDMEVSNVIIEMDAGKTQSVGGAAIKTRGTGFTVTNCEALRTDTGLSHTGFSTPDVYGGNAFSTIVTGFVARSCRGPGIGLGADAGYPAHDFSFTNVQIFDCVQDGGARGSIHITAGIGHRFENVKVVGHLGTTSAILFGGSLGAEIKRVVLKNVEVVWPDTGAPSQQSGSFGYVNDGEITGLTLVNTPTIGWRFTNTTRCSLRNVRGINLTAVAATIQADATCSNSVIEVSSDIKLAADSGTGNHFIWPMGKITSVTGTYTGLIADQTIIAGGTGAAYTVGLPLVSRSKNKILTIKRTHATQNITVDGFSTETIDGALSKVLASQYAFVTLRCDGTAWYVIALDGTVT